MPTSVPGSELRLLLDKMFPGDAISGGKDDQRFVNRVDYALAANGELSSIVRESLISYMLRRLVKTAQMYKRENDDAGLDASKLVERLRSYLRRELNFDRDHIEKVVILLVEITKIAEPSTGRVNSVKRQLRANGAYKCYVCGRAVQYNDDTLDDYAELEHIWPNSLGGPNTDENFDIACKKCNKAKEDYMDASDFHIEHATGISLRSLNRHDRVSIWSKTGNTCVYCGESASYIGQLYIARNNRNDCWHFINLVPFCGKHYTPEPT
jgi:5-methylcytosine-specific restriction endonuclease McrA